ncbi:MAG: aminotransferase class I/II-fold pyridoxal phosphate-dependent enzyme [Firmicutes bacterium]|nr:aminotransferase class I/II-fold pyridoxal phosphate-dependent enzyme [Bacillota bacterium]
MDYSRIVNQSVRAVPPSGIRKFFDIVAEMPDAISLGVGEPDFVTPGHIRDAAIDSIEQGMTQYTSNWGRIQLRALIAEYLRERFALHYAAKDEVLVTVGGSEGIDLALRAIVSPGDEVLVPDPSFVAYAAGVRFAGGVPVPIPTPAEDAFRLRPEVLRAAITPRTKAVIFPYPNNPTGSVMPRAGLTAIAEVLADTDIIVLSDEIYAELSYGGEPHVSIATLPGMRERTVLLSGFSKSFAMTGWRVGYACGPREIIEMMCKIHQYTIMCASIQGQIAAEQALSRGLENDFQDIQAMVRSYDRRRRLMVDGFEKMGLRCFAPLGAFYVFPSIAMTGLGSEAFCEKLLYAEQVACVPGMAFGASGEGHIRCCYATAVDKLTEALKRIERFVKGL